MRTADFTCTPLTRGAGERSRGCETLRGACQKAEYLSCRRDSRLCVRALRRRDVEIYSKRSGSLREISSHSGWNENQPAACPAELSRV